MKIQNTLICNASFVDCTTCFALTDDRGTYDKTFGAYENYGLASKSRYATTCKLASETKLEIRKSTYFAQRAKQIV